MVYGGGHLAENAVSFCMLSSAMSKLAVHAILLKVGEFWPCVCVKPE